MVNIRIISFLIICFSSLQTGFSQELIRINLSDIPQRKVRNYISTRSIDKMDSYNSIHPSWKNEAANPGYKVIEKTFFLNYKLSSVWDFYRHANTFKMWNEKSIRFGLLLSRCPKSVVYARNSFCPAVDTGQIYFLNLRFMKGLFNIPVAFQIINIDQFQRMVEFSYIENNKSRGKQSIQFFDDGPGRTRIVHKSYFKSNSAFRDHWLYPYFHKKFIREFHRNMNKLIKNEMIPVFVLK
jgi:hypothetical protein